MRSSIPIRHGTYDGYHNHKCRCEECKRANSEYQRHAKAGDCADCGCLIWAGTGSVRCKACSGRAQQTQEHGTYGKYSRGCRCDVCRAHQAKVRRDWRSKNLERARAYDRERKRSA